MINFSHWSHLTSPWGAYHFFCINHAINKFSFQMFSVRIVKMRKCFRKKSCCVNEEVFLHSHAEKKKGTILWETRPRVLFSIRTLMLLNISLIKIILGHFNYVLKMIHTIFECIAKLFSKLSHPKRHFLWPHPLIKQFPHRCLKSDSPDSFCQTGFSFLQLRRERSFFRRTKQFTTKLVSLCLSPLLNDEANDYKLYRDYPDIYFFPGRSFEEEQFTYHDEVHEINALIEEVNHLRR